MNTAFNTAPRSRKKTHVSLRESEKNLVHLLDNEIVRDLENDMEDQILQEEETTETFPDETHNAQILLSLALKHDDITILRNILEDLRDHSLKKWEKFSVGDLYPTLLTDTIRLNKQCTAQELSIISRAIEHKTGRKFYISSKPKAVNVNLLAQAFGGEQFLAVPKKNENVKYKVKSLQSRCKEIIMEETYKVEQLQVSLANAIHCEKKTKWL